MGVCGANQAYAQYLQHQRTGSSCPFCLWFPVRRETRGIVLQREAKVERERERKRFCTFVCIYFILFAHHDVIIL